MNQIKGTEEKGLIFVIAVDFGGFPTVIYLPEHHKSYWEECGAIADEWLDIDKLKLKPGVYEMIIDYKETDKDFEYKIKSHHNIKITQI